MIHDALFGIVPFLENKYIFSGLILVTFAILGWLVLVIFGKYLTRLAKNTKTKIDDMIFAHTKRPLFYLVLAYGFRLAILNLGFAGAVPKIVDSVMAVVFVYIIIQAVDIIIETWGMTLAKKTKTKIDEVLLPLFHKASKTVFVIIALLWVLDVWEVDITPYLAGVGISGLVLGFALQDSLKNIFGGVTLLLDKTYKIGDKVMLESGQVGEILDIGLRSTKMRTYDHEVLFIPNGYLANSRVLNYTRPDPKVRVAVEFGVEYGSDVANVKKVVLESVQKIEGVLADPEPLVNFLAMGDSALLFNTKFWVEDWSEGYGKKLEATEKIYNALNKAKIGIPFPTRTVYTKSLK